jgi:hypothetical protein
LFTAHTPIRIRLVCYVDNRSSNFGKSRALDRTTLRREH